MGARPPQNNFMSNQNNNQLSFNFDDFDSFFEDMKNADIQVKDSAPKATPTKAQVKPTEVKTGKKKPGLNIDGVKTVVMAGEKKVSVKEGMFDKKTASAEEVVKVYLEAAGIKAPAGAFTAMANGKTEIRIAYNKDGALSDGSTVPVTFMGFRVRTPEGDVDFFKDATDATIREAVAGKYPKYAEPLYRFVDCGEATFYPIPVATEFVLPFSEKLSVKVGDKDVELTFEAKKAEPNKAAEDDEEENDEEAVDNGGTEELSSETIAAALRKAVKDDFFDVAKTADGTILAVPRVVKPLPVGGAKTPYVSESDKKRPITPELRIEWGYGHLDLFGIPETEGMTEISEKEALSILKKRNPIYKEITGMKWFEDKQFWFPNYPSSTKGAETPLFAVTETETGCLFCAPKRIPKSLISEVARHFFEEMRETGNESAAALIYNKNDGTWRVSYPTILEASPVSVVCNYWEDVNVANGEVVGVQMHSHPNMSISFSSIDDRDEIYEGVLYAVFRKEDNFKDRYIFDARFRQDGKFQMFPLDLILRD